jgi:hypothetical protein
VPLRRDAVPHVHIRDEAADLGDLAGEFVSHDYRRFHSPSGPFVPFVNVNVGSADAGPFHPNENFVIADHGAGHVFQDKAASG